MQTGLRKVWRRQLGREEGSSWRRQGSTVSSISAVLPTKIGVLSPARPSQLPAPSCLGTLFASFCPYPPLISAFVCLTPAYRGAVSPSEVGTGSSFSAAAC